MKKDKWWLKQEISEIFWRAEIDDNLNIQGANLIFDKIDDAIDQLDEPEKVVIPLFMAEHIIRQKELTATLLQAIGGIKLSGTEMVNWITKDGNDVLFCKAWLYGYEVEKEKLYRVRAGNRYVRFNLDGSIIGVKKDNSIVCLERLSKLPFDYKKAVESGIITLEEVTE